MDSESRTKVLLVENDLNWITIEKDFLTDEELDKLFN